MIFEEAERLGGPAHKWLQRSPGPLSTGEGLVHRVRDASDEKDDDDKPVDPGVDDKRLLVIEGELGAPLKAAQREGNTLSAILRTAWDNGNIAPLTKSNRIRATNAHINVVGHITRQELSQLLRTCDIWNGFANRVLWFCVRRPKQVPFPEPMPPDVVADLAGGVRAILDHASSRERVKWSAAARRLWEEMYPKVTAEESGAFGAVTARAEAQLQRLALVYALIDCSSEIEPCHFLAAMAVWDYARQSARLIFEGAGEDPNRAKVVAMLGGGPLTQSEINVRFGGHLKGAQLRVLLEDLQASRVIRAEQQSTSGRPATRWFLHTEGAEKAEEAEKAPPSTPYSASSAYSAGGKS